MKSGGKGRNRYRWTTLKQETSKLQWNNRDTCFLLRTTNILPQDFLFYWVLEMLFCRYYSKKHFIYFRGIWKTFLKVARKVKEKKRHHGIPQLVVNEISLNCPSLIQLQAENYKILLKFFNENGFSLNK